MSSAIVAYGAVSALGVGRAAFDVGPAGRRVVGAWSSRPPGRPFGRASACAAARADRPRALLELGLGQVIDGLDAWSPAWRQLRLGVVVGTSSGGFAALERAVEGGVEHDPANWRKSAYFAPLDALDLLRPSAPQRLVSLYAACASSTCAIGLGMRWIELDEVDLVIAGGYDAESDWVCAGFDALKATSAHAPNPFRLERDGMALGEAVALVALSRRSQGALGFLRGFSATSDALHITAPDRTGRSLARAISTAMAEAELEPAGIDFVSVHGTATSFNDAAEAAALGLVFAEQTRRLRGHAFKSVVGHTLGAAGALESLAAVSALQNGVLPASASVGTPMPELPSLLLEKNATHPVEHCLKLSTAFGGSNAALVISRRAPPWMPRSKRPVHLLARGVRCSEFDLARLHDLLAVSPERLPRSDQLSALAVAASGEALRAVALVGVELSRPDVGVVVGSVGSTLEANAQFGARISDRGRDYAEPRRFPATSPNACAGQVSIAFGLGGPAHAVGSGSQVDYEALQVAHTWIAAGDARAMLVVVAEQTGSTASQALGARGVGPRSELGFAVVLSDQPLGPVVDERELARARAMIAAAEVQGFVGLEAWSQAANLPGP